jgi:nucleoside-diphosphate-sugar epimerase
VIVAVTGATGYVGRFIVKRLIGAGVGVRAWRRQASDLRGLPDSIAWVSGDLSSPATADALVEGADMLVHAALEHTPGRYRGGEGADLAGYFKKNIGGSFALLEAARKAGVERAIVLSSRAVFGASVIGPIGDDAPVSPDTDYGIAKAALEECVRSFGREGWAIAALRPTGVYGVVEPPEKSKWLALVKRALKGEAIESRAGTEVHGDDVAESIWRLLTADGEAVAGRTFNCSDIVVSTRDIVAEVQSVAGVPGPLPEEAPGPKGVMQCDALHALGVTFGGTEKFKETVAALVPAAR